MTEERKPCGLPAMFRYTWPGKEEEHCCIIHAHMVLNVANAIGLPLQMIRLIDEEMFKDIKCSNETPLPEGE
ncbi:hypothetical protein EH221_07400 [bacterium]|nr:MAG: hypothetical protein EH221_07400 [bacterium]